MFHEIRREFFGVGFDGNQTLHGIERLRKIAEPASFNQGFDEVTYKKTSPVTSTMVISHFKIFLGGSSLALSERINSQPPPPMMMASQKISPAISQVRLMAVGQNFSR